jgi:hypothetical protein
MRALVRIFFVLGIALLTLSKEAHAQRANEVFGKNRIQYRSFDWVYLSGENFDVYYYDNRKAVATEALQYLESEFDRLTDLLGYSPYFKTRVFLYNSLADLRQSNVGLNRTEFTVNGEIEFIKPYVEVPHLGTGQEFKQELLFKVTDLFVNEMMYGGSLKEIFQSALLMNLSDWFVLGASQYAARGWTMEMDDYIREIIKTRRARNFNRFEGREAALIGQSFWNFIVERYGKSSISNILNYTRITRNEEKSILITLGVSFKQVHKEWQDYYLQQHEQVNQSYIKAADSTRLRIRHNKTTQLTTIKVSPDGKYVAYAENDRGRYIVKVRSLETRKETTILTQGSKVIGQEVDYRLPIIGWSDANTLGVIAVRNGEYTFWLYDLSSRTKLPRELDRFNNVRSISFSTNGRLAVVSADMEGKNDLYLISTRRDRVRRITNDLYDDLDPTFIPNTNRIVFSSNRTTDSLNAKSKATLNTLNDNYNLYVFDLDSTNTTLAKVTNTISKDYSPIALNDNVFYYLSDQRGIVNLFKYDRSTTIYTQVTNFSTSIKDFDLDPTTNTFGIITSRRLYDQLFVDRNFNLNRQVFTPTTRRKEVQQARVIREKRQKEENKTMSIRDLINQRMRMAQEEFDTVEVDSTQMELNPDQFLFDSLELKPDSLRLKSDSLKLKSDSLKVKPDSLVNKSDTVVVAIQPKKTDTLIDTDNYTFEGERPVVRRPSVVSDTLQPRKPDEPVNTENYVFEDDVVRSTMPSESFLNRYMKARDKSRVTGPFPYESRFSADNLITAAVIDPMRGFGILFERQMNDMLENYRLLAGLMTTFDLRNGDFYAEAQYLPRLLDFNVRFDRKGIRWEPFLNSDTYKYALNRFEVGVSMPFSDRARVSFKPFGAVARSMNLGRTNTFPVDPPTQVPKSNFYAGAKTEFVYDNSVVAGMNIIEGTKAKFTITLHEGLNNRENSFGQMSADLRHYQKIYKDIVLAVRGFGGSFFGRSPKVYLLGGMDNWAFNETQYDGNTAKREANPLGIRGENQDLLFVEYATNLRGFDYATLFGNNVLLMNAEFRIPLIRTFTNAPVASSFFKNLQIIGFYDIGTSWSGKPPFSGERSVSVDEYNSGPFQVDVNNYLNPWLYSYGVGMRTVFLGYYMKLDVAWPVENYQVQNTRWFVTLGFDF